MAHGYVDFTKQVSSRRQAFGGKKSYESHLFAGYPQLANHNFEDAFDTDSTVHGPVSLHSIYPLNALWASP